MCADVLEFEREAAENPFVEKFDAFFRERLIRHIERLVGSYPGERSLLVDFKEIERFDPELADALLDNPDYVLEAAEKALSSIDIPLLEAEEFAPHVRVFNLPKENSPVLRDIGAAHIGRLISIEGLVRAVTEVRPKLEVAVWECRRCASTYSVVQPPQHLKMPNICECKHRDFALVAEKSTFTDWQKIQVQEPIELLKGSEQPTNLHIYMTDDLVNRVSPGTHTKVTGIVRLRHPKDKDTIYERYLEALHVDETAKEFEEVKITPEEELEIKALAKNPGIYEILRDSIASTIYGHDSIKDAIVLQLFGGIRKENPDGSKTRGNIHVLLVGDPGLAKSKLLLAVHEIAPKSIYVAGKTTTGAGISATAVKDEFGEGGWTLKAGALVLANGGMIMIDEFEKMDEEDRSALHEALEQQTVSVAKAGIVTTFKTETSLLAAANPTLGRFDPRENLLQQIKILASLLSRFDLFFTMKDVLDREKDAEIANTLLTVHRAGQMAKHKGELKKGKWKGVFEELTKGVAPPMRSELLGKYISYARQKVFPVMDEDSTDAIREFYLNLREQSKREERSPVTPRQLEAVVRLSEASARARLSDRIEKKDVERATGILRASFRDVLTDETGTVDMDVITIGQTHTQLSNLRKILSMVKAKAQELDMVPKQDVIEEAKLQGIDADKAEELIDKLVKSGELYRPQYGFLKPMPKD